MLPNYAQTFIGDIWGTLRPEVTWRGSGTAVLGQQVAFPTDFTAYTNDSAAVSIDKSSANYLWRNVDTCTRGNTDLGVTAVVTGVRGTGAAGSQLEVCLFDPDVLVKIVGGTGVTEAAGQFLFTQTVLATPAVTAAGTLYAHPKASVDGATDTGRCFGFALETPPDSTAALKRCFFVGWGYFAYSGGA